MYMLIIHEIIFFAPTEMAPRTVCVSDSKEKLKQFAVENYKWDPVLTTGVDILKHKQACETYLTIRPITSI